MGNTAKIIHELKTNPKWRDTLVAYCSCTDEPAWADECMRLFEVGDGITLESVRPQSYTKYPLSWPSLLLFLICSRESNPSTACLLSGPTLASFGACEQAGRTGRTRFELRALNDTAACMPVNHTCRPWTSRRSSSRRRRPTSRTSRKRPGSPSRK